MDGSRKIMGPIESSTLKPNEADREREVGDKLEGEGRKSFKFHAREFRVVGATNRWFTIPTCLLDESGENIRFVLFRPFVHEKSVLIALIYDSLVQAVLHCSR